MLPGNRSCFSPWIVTEALICGYHEAVGQPHHSKPTFEASESGSVGVLDRSEVLRALAVQVNFFNQRGIDTLYRVWKPKNDGQE